MSRSYQQLRRSALSQTAKETKAALPSVLRALPGINAAESSVLVLSQLPALDTENCPKFTIQVSGDEVTGAQIQVINDDTLDTAIRLSQKPLRHPVNSQSPAPNSHVAVLNLASDHKAGGGWLNGALAQEESICYRSSLYLSLHRSYYPFGPLDAVYTPFVVVIRDSWGAGHNLLIPNTEPTDLSVVSMISIAAIRRPKIRRSAQLVSGTLVEKFGYENAADRDLTKDKMRLILRVAASKGHRRLVLGALGCGAFRNPTEEVATCWQEVLQEAEFRGGWWEEVVFAVLDKGSDGDNGSRDQNGNFATFHRQLDGVVV
jgi:uncharacterized protein (TIGR02452 family)